MFQVQIEKLTEYRKKMTFINPKCGHAQDYEYTTPWKCSHAGCEEKNPQVDKLESAHLGQANRVKYFVDGTV